MTRISLPASIDAAPAGAQPLLEAVKKKKHKHEVHVEDTPHPDRKKR